MEKIKQVLKITSEFRSHKDNMAKEYALLENGEFLTLGRDCLLFENRSLLRIERVEGGKIRTSHIEEKYTLCYGISLTNIISILANKDVQIVGINTYKGERDRKYVLTLLKKYSQIPESYFYDGDSSLERFEHSDLGYFICQLYSI
jgi:hypothetical protein